MTESSGKVENMRENVTFWTPYWSGGPNGSKFEVTWPPHAKCDVDL